MPIRLERLRFQDGLSNRTSTLNFADVLIPKAMMLEEIQAAMETDTNLSTVKDSIKSNNWPTTMQADDEHKL